MANPKFVIFLFYLSGYFIATGQDISNIKNIKPLTWNANFNANFSSFFSDNNQSLYDPFSYGIAVNGNVSIYDVSIPFTMQYRDRNTNFGTSFSRFGIRPRYKWITAYLGHNQVEFNRYVFSGMQFFGAGLELNPGIFRAGYITGELKNPKYIVDSLNNNNGFTNIYKRSFSAYKIGIGKTNNFIDLYLLNANDNNNSILFSDSLTLNPQSNTSLGTTASVSLFNKVMKISVNAATSILTNNVEAKQLDSADLAENKAFDFLNKHIKINKSSNLNWAGDANLDFNFGSFSIGTKYQRINPFYQSFGINFLRGDRENISLHTSMNLFNNILNVNANYGIDRNNLLNIRTSTTKQKVYDINIQFTPKSWFTLDAQYSNYNFNQQPTIISILDTFKFVQINETKSISPTIKIVKKDIQHSIFLNYTLQSLNDLTSIESSETVTNYRNISSAYQWRHRKNKTSFGITFFSVQNKNEQAVHDRYGINLSGSKSFLKNKLAVRTKVSISKNRIDNTDDGYFFNFGPGVTYQVGKGSLALQAMYLNRPNTTLEKNTNELRLFSNFSIPLK